MSGAKPYILPAHPLLRQNDDMGTKILKRNEQNTICFLITSVEVAAVVVVVGAVVVGAEVAVTVTLLLLLLLLIMQLFLELGTHIKR